MSTQSEHHYFPLSVTTGKAFCNRKNEIKQLTYCINHARPILLVSPRRYGKTSLALHTISQIKLPYAQFDFFSVVDEMDIEVDYKKSLLLFFKCFFYQQ